MPSNAMIIVPLDSEPSQNGFEDRAVPDMPLYAVIRTDGQFEILNPDLEDTPRYTLTAAALEELRHEH